MLQLSAATLWTHTGTASVILVFLVYLVKQNLKSEARTDLAEERERATRQELAAQTLALTATYKDVTFALNTNSDEHKVITEALRHLIVKEEVRIAVDNHGG